MGFFDFNKPELKKDSLEAILAVVYLIAVSGDGMKVEESKALSFLYYWLLYESKSKKSNHIPSLSSKSGKEFVRLLKDQKKLKSEIGAVDLFLSKRELKRESFRREKIHVQGWAGGQKERNIRNGYEECTEILMRVNKEFIKSLNKGNPDKMRDKYYKLITDKYNREITLKMANAVSRIDGLNEIESRNLIDLKMYWMADEI